MPESYEVKPNKTVFVNYYMAKSIIINFIIFSILYVFLSTWVNILIFIGIYILFMLFNYYRINVHYKKRRYIFMSNKIIQKGGGIFSEGETELVIRNITNVRLRLPWIENKLFKTGSLSILSAGSGSTEVFMAHLDKPQEMYQYMQTIMQHNGFKLTQKNLVQQERPSTIGVFFEVFSKVAGVFFAILLLGIPTLTALVAYVMDLFGGTFGFKFYFLVLLVLIIILFIIIRIMLTFLDLKRRLYNVYSDTVTYSEGFLTKNYALIPMENLADSTITQTLVDKIFSLYDVKISCQGSNQEILFKNMVNGPKLEENIDKLIAKTKSLVGTEKKVKEAKVKKKAEYKAKGLKVDTSYTATFKMDGKRTIIPITILAVITFPLFYIWIFVIVSLIIKMSVTKYFIKENSVEEQYEFLTSKHKEFTNEKVTAVVIKENFIDRWFNTCSIHFWSIGSSDTVKFMNIKKTDKLYENILKKFGIGPSPELYKSDSQYNLLDEWKRDVFGTFIVLLFFIGSLVLTALVNILFILLFIFFVSLYIGIILYHKVLYRRFKLTFFKDYIYFQKGYLFQVYYYALYDNIKDITTIQYPFSNAGTIRYDIAGEHMVSQAQQGQSKGAVQSNHFEIPYIQDIETKDELIDLIFYQRPNAKQVKDIENNIQKYSPEPLLVSKQAIPNTIVPMLIFPPFWIFIPFAIWAIMVRSYIIQPYRVLSKSGIFYKKQKSIVFSKIDHINFSQGFLNKMFRNGNITINTAGSSTAELIVSNIPNFKEFYELLKKYY